MPPTRSGSGSNVFLISIDRERIAANLRNRTRLPVICVQQPGLDDAIYCLQVEIEGPSRVVYRPDRADHDDPAASAWVETEGPIRLVS